MRTRIVAKLGISCGLALAGTMLAASAYAAESVPNQENSSLGTSDPIINQSQSSTQITSTGSDSVIITSDINVQSPASVTGESTTNPSSISTNDSTEPTPTSSAVGSSSTDFGGSAPSPVTATISVTAVVPTTPQNSLNLTQLRQTIFQSYQTTSGSARQQSEGSLSYAVTPVPIASAVPQVPQAPMLPSGTLFFLQQITNMLASTFMPVLGITLAHNNPISLSVLVFTLLVLPMIAHMMGRPRQDYTTVLKATGYSHGARSDNTSALNTYLPQTRADGSGAMRQLSVFIMTFLTTSFRLSSFVEHNACRLDYPRLEHV